jgi:hypothetical protein
MHIPCDANARSDDMRTAIQGHAEKILFAPPSVGL